MKLINEYTKKELVELQPNDIQKIIHLHLANEGIAIPREPEEPQYEVVPEKDKTLFYIAGIENVYFDKREVAEEMTKSLRNNFSHLCRVKLDYSYDERNEQVTAWKVDEWNSREASINDIVVMEKAVYSIDLYMQIKNKIESNKKLKKDYEERKESFEKSSDAAKDIVNTVWETVRVAQREQEEKDRMLSTFKEYLALADGDKDIAWKFMNKAHTTTENQRDYINANIGGEA